MTKPTPKDQGFEKVYQYYESQLVLPTFANLGDGQALEDYVRARADFFTGKLFLPPAVFRGADVVEFGPDTGENALAFATWGADMTLVEPNIKAWPQIEKYFDAFGLAPRLKALVDSDVEEFTRDAPCDAVIAEGFIYTVQPMEAWLGAFHRLLKTDGFFIVSFYERLGGFVELSLKAICAQYRAITDTPAGDAVKTLFQAKWDSIPHTRTIDSWIMDVFENPFVRLNYFLDAADLCPQAGTNGFSLYSSWPKYQAPLEFDWHKTVLPLEERRRRDEDHLLRSGLSFLTGRKLYLVLPDREALEGINRTLHQLVEDMDALIDGQGGETLTRCIGNLKEIIAITAGGDFLSDRESDREDAVRFLGSLCRAFEMIAAGDAEGLAELTGTDDAFIGGWGLPNHFAVFQKRGNPPD